MGIELFPQAPRDTRRSSEIRAGWGSPPPQAIDRRTFEFWDGTPIPGGVNALAWHAVARLDDVFRSHGYELGGSADDWCWSRRRIKGSSRWSLHSWAIALDINATTNPFSKRFRTDLTPQIIADVQAVKHDGRTVWAWGGHWGRVRGRSFDPMHFQLNLFPAEAASMKAAVRPGVPPIPPGGGGVDAGRVDLLENRVEDLIEAFVHERSRVDVIVALLDGMPASLQADWLVKSARGSAATEEEVADVEARLLGGVSVSEMWVDMSRKVLG